VYSFVLLNVLTQELELLIILDFDPVESLHQEFEVLLRDGSKLSRHGLSL
jgi:hypothetical protein